MRFSLVIAHGKALLEIITIIVGLANGVTVAAVVCALTKKTERVSFIGILLGGTGILLGFWLCWLARWQFDVSIRSLDLASIILVSALSVTLSLRKRPVAPIRLIRRG